MQLSTALEEAGKGSLLAYMASTLPPGSNALNQPLGASRLTPLNSAGQCGAALHLEYFKARTLLQWGGSPNPERTAGNVLTSHRYEWGTKSGKLAPLLRGPLKADVATQTNRPTRALYAPSARGWVTTERGA
jgi:hypothetical protein